MQKLSLAYISLGCNKNTVDTEIMLAMFSKEFTIINDFSKADTIVVNTCGFIESAKTESINTILQVAQYKNSDEGICKALVVTGCLAQRYSEELMKEIPEIDLLIGVEQYPGIVERVKAFLDTGSRASFTQRTNKVLCGERLLITPPYSSYVRISDGCDHKCSYCAIPIIRGPYRSVEQSEVLDEVKRLTDKNVSEITLIAQDTSRFGDDFNGKHSLAELLTKAEKIDGVHWLRVLYCYPSTCDNHLLDTICSSPRICKYLDLPLQHANPELLKSMNRKGSIEDMRILLKDARSRGIILRTTMMVGFPGETDEQFNDLLDFVSEIKFDRLGAFIFSPEEGTVAAEMPNQIPEEIKQERLDALMLLQADISKERNESRIGEICEVLVEEIQPDGSILARSQKEAPDVDGQIILPANKNIKIGNYYQAKITNADIYDLYADWL